MKNSQMGMGSLCLHFEVYLHKHQTVKHIDPKSKQSFVVSLLAVVKVFLGGMVPASSHEVRECLPCLAGRGPRRFSVDLHRDVCVFLACAVGSHLLPSCPLLCNHSLLTVQVGNLILYIRESSIPEPEDKSCGLL